MSNKINFAVAEPPRETAISQILRMTTPPKRTAEEVRADVDAEIERFSEPAAQCGWDVDSLGRLRADMIVASEHDARLSITSVGLNGISFGPVGREGIYGTPRWPRPPEPSPAPEPAPEVHRCYYEVRCAGCSQLHRVMLPEKGA